MLADVVTLGEGKGDISLLGGKGASLDKLVRSGFNVPRGFVITVNVFDKFVKQCDIDKLIHEGRSWQEIRERIISCEFPEDIKALIETYYKKIGEGKVAVRSSATAEDISSAAFAGQYETFLNVEGIEGIIQAIKGCYASLFSDRVRAYLQNKRIDTDIKMAVVVQEMIDADYAGVMFTLNPTNGRKDEILINVVYGLGEALVSGVKTPTEYVVKKRFPYKVVSSFISGDGGDIGKILMKRLVNIGKKIEKFYGNPQDIEWAIKGDTIYVLQSRPITTRILPSVKSSILKEMFLKIVAEIIPYRPYPIDVEWIDFVVKMAVDKPFRFAGLKLPRVAGGIFKELDGVPVYVDPYMYTTEHGIADLMIYPYAVLTPFKIMLSMVNSDKVNWQEDRDYQKALKVIADLENAEVNDFKYRNKYLGKALYAVKLMGDVREKYIPSIFSGVLGLVMLLKMMGKGHLISTLLFAGVDTVITRSNEEMQEIAQMIREDEYLFNIFKNNSAEEILNLMEKDEALDDFKKVFYEFINRWRYREAGAVVFLSGASWLERPDVPLNMIKNMALSPSKVDSAEAKVDINKIIEKEIYSHPLMKNAYLRKMFDKVLHNARQLQPLREATRYWIVAPSSHIRRILKSIERFYLEKGCLGSKGDINYLRLSELDLPCEDVKNLVERRKKIFNRIKDKPFFPEIASVNDSQDVEENVILKGLPGSPGIASGKVCVVLSPEELNKMREGYILVAPYTTPSWTPLFSLASGVVVDSGGPLSHAAIVAREYGIPAVMGTGKATKLLKDGMCVEVDGSKGVVREGKCK